MTADSAAVAVDLYRAVHGGSGRRGLAPVRIGLEGQHPPVSQHLRLCGLAHEKEEAADLHLVHHLACDAGDHVLLQVWIAVAVGLRRPAGELVRHPAGLVAEQVDDLPRRVRTQQGNGEAPRRLNGLAGLVVLVHR
ncbi:DUF2178 domain-containing protein, partial [Dysosmobacter welbionis]